MGVQSQIERIKNTVTSQTELIQEISNILDSKSTPTPQKLQDKTITPTATNQVITADTGYGGLNKVTVNGDAELVPENIKEGVNIFGVTGSMSGNTLKWTMIDTSKSVSVYAPDATTGFVVDLSFKKMPSYIIFENSAADFMISSIRCFGVYMYKNVDGSLATITLETDNLYKVVSVEEIKNNEGFSIRCTLSTISSSKTRYMALYQ